MEGRQCDICVWHHGSGCSRWMCEGETLDEHDERIKNELLNDVEVAAKTSHIENWTLEDVIELLECAKNGDI